jgi:DNA polymerase-1
LVTLCADIEGDGLLRHVTQLWCLVVVDAETGEVTRYNDENNGRLPIADGLARLQAADRVVFHNGVGYDFAAIEKVRGVRFRDEQRFDTMVLSRLFNPERREGHSIESFGEQFGMPKDVEANDFTQWSERLEDRCVNDAQTTACIWRELEKRGVLKWGRSVEIEIAFAEIIALQMENGVSLNERLAIEVAADADEELKKLTVQLQQMFPPRFIPEKKHGQVVVKNPKRPYAQRVDTPYGYKVKRHHTPGAPFTVIEREEFNPGSGPQIADRFIRKYGWTPTKFTDGGAPSTDEEVLKNLDYPEAKLLARFQRVDKMWGQIAAPKKKDDTGGGWLHHINPETGRIHGYVNSNGAVTGRCTHSRPNTANVDKKDKRLRAMWIPREGWVFLGADAEGLELRMLAHYLAYYDGGEYGVALIEGRKDDETDAHSRTRKLIGLLKRDNAKRVIYALIYGAGDAKLGLIIIEDALEHDKYNPTDMPHLFRAGKNGKLVKRSPSDLGKQARDKLETGIKGLRELKEAIRKKIKATGKIRGLDGRWLRIRSEHSALNTLLQGGGAIVMKLALVLFHRAHRDRYGVDFAYCLNVHDEVQIECRTREIAEELGPKFAACITEAGKQLGVRCPLAGSYDIGASWADTH